MPSVSETSAYLRFLGDDLDPDELTTAIGIKPDEARRRGAAFVNPAGIARTARTGMWGRAAKRHQPGDLDRQVRELLLAGTAQLEVWRMFSKRFGGELFCGLHLNEWNEGLNLGPEVLVLLSERGLALALDIYFDPERP